MINKVLETIVGLLILALIWWAVDYFRVTQPLLQLIRAVLVVGGVVVVIRFLLGLRGTGGSTP